MVLAAVVAVGLGGKMIDRPPSHAEVEAFAPSVPAAVVVAELPAPTPSFRSDWPAAIASRQAILRLYDDRAEWQNDHTPLDTTPPWVRRLGALSNFRTDPYQR